MTKKMPRFQVYKAKDGWRWRLLAANGAIIADSAESYVAHYSAKNAATRTRLAAIQSSRVLKP